MSDGMPGRRRIGLALGGGAVRGAAHVGVLQVLEGAGIRPDVIAGTSIGAIVGAGYAAGLSTDALVELFGTLNWNRLVRPMMRVSLNLLSSGRLRRFLAEALPVTTFEELAIPFRAVACDINRGEPVVLGTGDVVEAICASSALPGLFTPIQHGDRLLVDGGVVNNLPLDVVRDMGADYVIGVDVVPRYTQGEPPSNLAEVWQRTFFLLSSNAAPPRALADYLITPDVGGFLFSDFRNVDALIERGREAAEAALPELRAALALEDDPPPHPLPNPTDEQELTYGEPRNVR